MRRNIIKILNGIPESMFIPSAARALENKSERSIIVDSFIKKYDKVMIVNIGCVLDTRQKRLKIKHIPWVDIGITDVIKIRKKFFYESEHNIMIAKSMFDYIWIEDVKKWSLYDKNAKMLFLFEGVLMNFDETGVKNVLKNRQ